MKKFIFSMICTLLPILASAQESYWEELQSTIEHGTEVLSQAKESGNVHPGLVEELEIVLEKFNEEDYLQEASEWEVRTYTKYFNLIINEIEEAMKGGESDVEPYAVLSDNDTVLTFYYDDQKEARGGMDVGPFNDIDQRGWFEQSGSIEQVVFDESFANCTTITRTTLWFHGFSNLTTITGLEYLKTDNVRDMGLMFSSCSSLTSLDLSTFNTSNVWSMNSMFENCSSLTSLDLSTFNTSNLVSMNRMFRFCTNLTNIDISGFDTSNVMDMRNMFEECEELTSLDLSGFNTSHVKDMSRMFYKCWRLTSLDVSGFNTSNVMDMRGMFYECEALTSLDVSGFNTSKVTDMSNMFEFCPGLTSLDVSGFNTSNVTNMIDMFNYCSGLTSLDVSGFNTQNVTNMQAMFDGCSGLTSLDVTGFNTQNVTNMSSMFAGCSSLTSLDVSGFNTQNVTDMRAMFSGCSSLTSLDVSGFNTQNVTDLGYMFSGCSSLTTIYVGSDWTTDNIVESSGMFEGCVSLVGGNGTQYSQEHMDASYAHIDTEGYPGYFTASSSGEEPNWQELNYMLEYGADVLSRAKESGNVDQWMLEELEMFLNQGHEMYKEHTASAEEVRAMTEDLEWRIREVEEAMKGGGEGGEAEPYAVLSEDNTVLTFYYDNEKDARGGMDVGPFPSSPRRGWQNYVSNIISVVFDATFANCTSVTSTRYWFQAFTNLTSITGLENLNTSNVTDMTLMFNGCSNLTSLDVSHFNTDNVTEMRYMFGDCRNLTRLDVSHFNTRNVQDMTNMFDGCSGLTNLDLRNFDTSSVTEMSHMFEDCTSLISLDVSSFNTSKVSFFNNIFAGCTSLTSLDITNFDTSNATYMAALFKECSSLTSLDLSNFNTTNVTNMETMFGGCTNLTTVYVSNLWSVSNVSASSRMFQNCGSLVGGSGTTYDANNINATYAHIDGGESNPGYLTGINGGSETSEEAWAELHDAVDRGDRLLTEAREAGTVEDWALEELENMTVKGSLMYEEHKAGEEEVRHMTEELNHIIWEVEEMMKGGSEASEEAWAELHDAVDRGDRLLPEAREAGTVEDWALEELENMTVKGSLMYEEHKAGEEEVRHMTEELNHIIWEVEEMMHHQPQSEAYYQNFTAYVYGDATLEDAFAEVGRETAIETIAAIVWEGNDALTDEMLSGIDNPNLLVFVKEASKAPASVQNVVINGVAEEIILTDATGNNNFFCPQPFKAQSISYTRNFSQTTEIEVCRGWETISLPFDVQSIRHESHGTLVPFGGGNSGYPFWLRQLTENGLTQATQIEANRPYLISMPNNSIYPASYNQNGNVTFSATDVDIPETMTEPISSDDVTIQAAFQRMAQSSSVYALNVGEARGEYPEGSVFEQNYREIRPFQAFTTHRAGTRYISIGSLGDPNDQTTGIQNLIIGNGERKNDNWYTLDGRRLDVKPTKKGVYVKDGRKIVIK